MGEKRAQQRKCWRRSRHRSAFDARVQERDGETGSIRSLVTRMYPLPRDSNLLLCGVLSIVLPVSIAVRLSGHCLQTRQIGDAPF